MFLDTQYLYNLFTFAKDYTRLLWWRSLSKTTKLNLLFSFHEEVCIDFNFISLSNFPLLRIYGRFSSLFYYECIKFLFLNFVETVERKLFEKKTFYKFLSIIANIHIIPFCTTKIEPGNAYEKKYIHQFLTMKCNGSKKEEFTVLSSVKKCMYIVH